MKMPAAPLTLPAQVALPSPDANEAQIIEIDVAVMALPNVPKQDRLAHSVIRGLGKGAWARDGAAAVVEPVSRDVPGGNFGHGDHPVWTTLSGPNSLTVLTSAAGHCRGNQGQLETVGREGQGKVGPID